MNEKDIRSALFHWYREAIDGNPAAFAQLHQSVETFYFLDLVSDDLYNLSLYLSENLRELEILDSRNDVVPVPEPEDLDLPFPELLPYGEEVLPFA